MESKTKKGFLPALAAVGIIVAVLLLCYRQFCPQPAEGRKEIVVEVVDPDGSTETYAIETSAQYLEQALADAAGLTVEGSRTEQFGLMILTVNGITADYNKDQAYWAIERNGEACRYGVSQQPIQDQERYRLVYTAAGGR